jgi:hypothetical protein
MKGRRRWSLIAVAFSHWIWSATWSETDCSKLAATTIGVVK